MRVGIGPRHAAAALAAVVLAAAGPGAAAVSAQPSTTLTALVAANAAGPFDELIAQFERAHPGVVVKASYAGTQILTTQLEQGAPADVFLSADLAHVEKLAGEKLIGAYRPVSEGHEVIVVPKDDPAGVASLRDLGDKRLKLVIGVPDVPIGKYARAVFAKAGAAYGADFARRALANVVSLETDVKQVLQKTALGEADAGIVYRTDVAGEAAAKVRIVEIPARFNVPAYNYIAVTRASAPLARELVALALSPRGQAIFARYHYDPLRPPAGRTAAKR